ncbi:MAG: acetaldehyde dehydrogenase (acetylating) [bacterium]
MPLDKDLQSVQEARDLAKLSKEAQLEFKYFSQNQVDNVVKAMVDAGYQQAERLAKMAHEETGFGKWQDKVIKNQFGTKGVYDSIRNLKTVGVIDVQQNGKIVKIAEPMGVVAALIPSTNPTSTAMFKSIISLKCRNGVVASPHPKAINCTMEAIKVISSAAEKAGAPKGLIQCMTTSTLEGTNALMKDKNIAIILATGSTPMVKAAYSTGTPALGVGSGNVPAFIERTADYKKAVADIITGTTFDNGTLCSSEQAMIVDRPLKDRVIDEAKKQGAYFVNADEKKKLEKAIMKDGRINPDVVGKSAVFIAEYSGFKVPESTTVLIAECTGVGKHEPLSIEKLSPVLAFYVVDGWLEGCHKSIELLEFGGIGHTMVIHSNDKDIIMKFAIEKPAFRILVNTVGSLGAVGYTTSLDPSLTLGPGTWGGSIISENVTAKHLMNIKTLAFESNAMNHGTSVSGFEEYAKLSIEKTDSPGTFTSRIEERLRARAGNPPSNPFDVYKKQTTEHKKDGSLGSGITEDEIQKIIREFNK